MGHCIQAIIGTHQSIKGLVDSWNCTREIELPQGYAMVFLTDALFDDVTELFGDADDLGYSGLDWLTAAVGQLLQQCSSHTKLVYVETDYCGGTGTQAGVLYENGHISIEPRSGEGTINLLLKELVQHCTNNGEYSTCYLRQYRVVVSQQCHRIASFLRLVLTQISGTVFHRYLGNAVLGVQCVSDQDEFDSLNLGKYRHMPDRV